MVQTRQQQKRPSAKRSSVTQGDDDRRHRKPPSKPSGQNTKCVECNRFFKGLRGPEQHIQRTSVCPCGLPKRNGPAATPALSKTRGSAQQDEPSSIGWKGRKEPARSESAPYVSRKSDPKPRLEWLLEYSWTEIEYRLSDGTCVLKASFPQTTVLLAFDSLYVRTLADLIDKLECPEPELRPVVESLVQSGLFEAGTINGQEDVWLAFAKAIEIRLNNKFRPESTPYNLRQFLNDAKRQSKRLRGEDKAKTSAPAVLRTKRPRRVPVDAVNADKPIPEDNPEKITPRN